MQRRQFIAGVGAALVAQHGSLAQQAVPVIGILGAPTATAWASFVVAFRQGLSEAGYTEGQNVVIEARWADGQYDRLPALAADLIHRSVTVIAAFTTPAALAAKAATAKTPIVFTTISDPVQVGLVASLSHPGSNVTGVTTLNVEIGSKQFELMHELTPPSVAIAVLVNPSSPNAKTLLEGWEKAARSLRRQQHILQANIAEEIDAAFAQLAEMRAGGVVIGADTFLNSRSEQLAKLALRYSVPATFSSRAFAEAGGLMTYEGNARDSYRQAGAYTARVLKGERPAVLPVVQPTKFELVINLKTAKALGLSVPPTLLALADEVIE